MGFCLGIVEQMRKNGKNNYVKSLEKINNGTLNDEFTM